MYIKIKSPESVLVVPCDNAGPLLAVLQHAKAVNETGWGDNAKLTFSDSPIELTFVKDDFMAEPEAPLKKAIANYESSQTSWLAEYQKRTVLEKEVKELTAKLEALKQAATL